MTARPLAVIVASGGMDSCVSAAIARQEYELALFHLNYGQLTEARELRAFREQAEYYNAKYLLEVDAGHFRQIGGSALTDSKLAIPDAKNIGKGVPVTYVPFRNANILAMAVSWAEVIGGVRVFIGAVEEDSSGYPDCRESFINAFNDAIREGTRPGSGIRIEAPLLHLNKGQIVRRGLELGAPLHLSWSCYQGENAACGTCESCVLRLRGFADAGTVDPIPYKR